MLEYAYIHLCIYIYWPSWSVEYTDYISSDGLDCPNQYPTYDTKKSRRWSSTKAENLGRQSNALLQSLPGPFWPVVAVPDRVQSMGK